MQINDTFCSEASGLCIENRQQKCVARFSRDGMTREMFHRHVAEKKILFWNIIIGVASLGIYAAVNAALVWSAIHS